MTLADRHAADIRGVLSCYDRVIIQGAAGTWGYVDGMTRFFNQNHLKIFDFAAVFTPITEQIKANAEQTARANGITIEYIRKSGAFRKEDRIQEILKERGEAEGLVHIFSVMETNGTYKPWCDKATGKCFFRKDQTKCLHYYFYFIDREFGLCFLKVPTIAPYRVTFYFNGHNWLAAIQSINLQVLPLRQKQ